MSFLASYLLWELVWLRKTGQREVRGVRGRKTRRVHACCVGRPPGHSSHRRISVEETVCSVVLGLWEWRRMERHRQKKSLGGNSGKQLLCPRLQASPCGSGRDRSGSTERGRDCFHLRAGLYQSGPFPCARITKPPFYLPLLLPSQIFASS